MSESPRISVHDNFLVSYEVHCERREIRLRTEFRDGGDPYEFTDVIFSGVVCYDFQHDSKVNVLFDITTCPAIEIYEEHCEQFRDGMRWNWTEEWAESPDAAGAFFLQNGIHGYRVESSLGFCGWILAREIHFVARTQKLSAEDSPA